MTEFDPEPSVPAAVRSVCSEKQRSSPRAEEPFAVPGWTAFHLTTHYAFTSLDALRFYDYSLTDKKM